VRTGKEDGTQNGVLTVKEAKRQKSELQLRRAQEKKEAKQRRFGTGAAEGAGEGDQAAEGGTGAAAQETS